MSACFARKHKAYVFPYTPDASVNPLSLPAVRPCLLHNERGAPVTRAKAIDLSWIEPPFICNEPIHILSIRPMSHNATSRRSATFRFPLQLAHTNFRRLSAVVSLANGRKTNAPRMLQQHQI